MAIVGKLGGIIPLNDEQPLCLNSDETRDECMPSFVMHHSEKARLTLIVFADISALAHWF